MTGVVGSDEVRNASIATIVSYIECDEIRFDEPSPHCACEFVNTVRSRDTGEIKGVEAQRTLNTVVALENLGHALSRLRQRQFKVMHSGHPVLVAVTHLPCTSLSWCPIPSCGHDPKSPPAEKKKSLSMLISSFSLEMETRMSINLGLSLED